VAYDPVKRAAREAAFRAEHGVSSGTYYRMRRQAEASGVSPSTFDRTAKQHGYQVAKQVTIEQRNAQRAYHRGETVEWDISDYEDYDLDKEWFFYQTAT
jgi:hypothetical protein